MIENYIDLLNIIKEKKYTTIIVSGPQRSGTTYIGNMLSEDLNYHYIDENDVEVYKFTTVTNIINDNKNQRKIIQMPAMSHCLHRITDKDTLIIFMYRDNDDIQKSMDRVNLHKWTDIDFVNYKRVFPTFIDKIDSFKELYVMKKWFWENIQKPICRCDYLDVSYEIVKQTKNYIEPNERINFTLKQIKKDN